MSSAPARKKPSRAEIDAAVESLMSTAVGRQIVIEKAAKRLLDSSEGKRRLLREERAAPVEGASDTLDFIANGGSPARKAVLGRLALTLVSAGLADNREAARLVGCSVRNVQILKTKFRMKEAQF